MNGHFRAGLAVLATSACLLLPRLAEARDYSQMSLTELEKELARRPMGPPIAVTIVGGLATIGGGCVALASLTAERVCRLSTGSCDNSAQIEVAGAVAGMGALMTTLGAVWLISWGQTRLKISDEIARRNVTGDLRATPLFLPGGGGLHLSMDF